MKLHSPRFERKLRHGVKRAVRASRELKRESRANRPRKQYSGVTPVRVALSVGFGYAVWHVTKRTGHAATGLGLMSLWALAWVFIRAQSLRMHLYGASDLPALSLLPLPDAVVFRWELWKFMRASAMSLLDFTAGFTALAWFGLVPAGRWFAIFPIAVVSWLALIALAILCIARLPRLPYPVISFTFMLGAGGVLLAGNFVGDAAIMALDRAAPTANWLLPTGWPVSLFQLVLGKGDWTALVLLIPIGLLFRSMPNSLAVLRADYRFGEQLQPEVSDLLPDHGEAETSPALDAAAGAPLRVGLTAIEDWIESRQFLATPQWPQSGWFEKRLWNWFNARERAVAEFVFPNGYVITRAWVKVARNLAFTAAAVALGGLAGPTVRLWILGAGLFVTVCQMFAVAFTSGAAFRSMFYSGVTIPIYAAYGIGYRELGRLLFKCTVVQFPFVLGFVVAGGALVAQVTAYPLPGAVLLAFKTAVLLTFARFILIALTFSSGSNDSTRLRARNLFPLAVILACGGLFLLLTAASLLVHDPVAPWVLWLLALLDAYAFYRIYGWFYHANRFDLMSLPRR